MASPPPDDQSLPSGPSTHFIAFQATHPIDKSLSEVFWKRSAHEILPNLWLGGLTAAQDVLQLRTHKIALVLSIRVGGAGRSAHISYRFNKIEQVVYEVQDQRGEDLGSIFAQTGRFIAGALGKGEGVLVHCAIGKSRSVVVVMAYLMQVKAMDTSAALKFVQEKRKVADPNSWFLEQLDEWDAELKDGGEQVGQRLKRLLQEEPIGVEAQGSPASEHPEASRTSSGDATSPASANSGPLRLRNFASASSRIGKRRKLVDMCLLSLKNDPTVLYGKPEAWET